MNKKGFTLVELLGVITILGLLGLVVVPVISNIISDNKKSLYESQISNIKIGVANFVSENVFSLDISEGESIGITLGKLQSMGYISEDIKDPITREFFDDDMVIIISKHSNEFQYTVCTSDVVCEDVLMY